MKRIRLIVEDAPKKEKKSLMGYLRRPGAKRGLVAFSLLVILGVCLVLVTLGVDALENTYGWQTDLSFNAVTSTSPITDELLSSLTSKVNIYMIYSTSADEDLPLERLLERYDAHSEQVHYELVNLTLNPTIASLYPTDAGDTLTANSLIVVSEETGRYKVITPGSFAEWGYDTQAGDYAISGVAYERQITQAIAYVIAEEVPQVHVLTGHGELTTEDISFFVSLLETNNYQVTTLSLGTDGVPEDRGVILLLSPQKDLTDGELEQLLAFQNNGGSLLVTVDYTDDLSQMSNFKALLRQFGVVPMDGLVVGDVSENGTTYYNTGDRVSVALIPYVQSSEITSALIEEKADTFLLVGARAFETPEASSAGLGATAVLQSGYKAYLRDFLKDGSTDMTQQIGDQAGPFTLAVLAESVGSTGDISHLFALGCSNMMTDENLYASTYNFELLLSAVSYLAPENNLTLDITSKQATRPVLSAAARVLGTVLIAAIPVMVLLMALAVLLPRRRK